MSTSLLLSPPAIGGRESLPLSSNTSAFFASTNLFLHAPCISSVRWRNFRSSLVVKSLYDDKDIPKQFRGENLREGLMDNYKNFPSSLYGLTPSQMEMFMPEDRPIDQKPGVIDEETLTSAHYFTKNAKLNMLDSYGGRRARARTQASRRTYVRDGKTYIRGGKKDGRLVYPPPDLPSFLLHKRMVYLGLPLYAPVTELIVAQLLWLDSYTQCSNIYLYINSTGTQDEYGRLVGAETDAFAIADCMSRVSATIHTINAGTAHGQAAMLLSLGEKGCRNLMPGCTCIRLGTKGVVLYGADIQCKRALLHMGTVFSMVATPYAKVYLPRMQQTFGDTTDLYKEAKELEAHTDIFLKFLERGVGRPKDVINEELQHGKFFMPRAAIKFGLADRIIKVAPGKEYHMPEDLKEYLKEEELKKAARSITAKSPTLKASVDG